MKDMNGYYGHYITTDELTKSIIRSQDSIFLRNMNIVELVLPECKNVYCWGNKLTKLIIPQSCENVECWDNQLIELIIPKNCKIINCSYNKLTKLIVPKSCTKVRCHNNNLHPIIIDLLESNDPIKMQLANNLQLTNL
jgi:hypothetical protein